MIRMAAAAATPASTNQGHQQDQRSAVQMKQGNGAIGQQPGNQDHGKSKQVDEQKSSRRR